MSQTGPLAGIRVIELGSYIAAPYAGALLASLGAEVIKVESPGDGDPFRRAQGTQSPYFAQYNAGKKSLAVGLKDPHGVALVRALIRESDVILENFRPGKLKALGLGPDDCRADHPTLIYASVSGFGDGGALSQRPAYDSVAQSVTGLYSLLNDAGEPRPTGAPMADLISGIVTAAGILAELVGRFRTGAGARVETSMFESVSALTIDSMTQLFETGVSPTRPSRHPQAQLFCVRTASGQFLTIHLSSSEKFWRRFAEVIGHPELVTDPRFADYPARVANYPQLTEVASAVFATRDAATWEAALLAADLPFAPVLRLDEVAAHPQTQGLQLLQDAPGTATTLVRAPWRLDGERPARGAVVPEVGEHTRELALEILPPDEVEVLVSKGVLYVPAPAPEAPPGP
jgi:crotonobetainyl-CoA:carnitine CoA-transferase CaiB-like acyl-CoA transferase